ncbi:hypothetical protein PUN4_150017 [Paraburkholderia unamae]|nr:hypothetical protein PUN4_150017 [Paraburkholderia unamae]
MVKNAAREGKDRPILVRAPAPRHEEIGTSICPRAQNGLRVLLQGNRKPRPAGRFIGGASFVE